MVTIAGQNLIVAHNYPNTYGKSWTEMELVNEDRTMVVGYARRTGVTPPGYPDRACYRIVLSFEQEQPGRYVYDDGDLIPVGKWIDSVTIPSLNRLLDRKEG